MHKTYYLDIIRNLLRGADGRHDEDCPAYRSGILDQDMDAAEDYQRCTCNATAERQRARATLEPRCAVVVTHAPKGQRGGPYKADFGRAGTSTTLLREAWRLPIDRFTSEHQARESAERVVAATLQWAGIQARVVMLVKKGFKS